MSILLVLRHADAESFAGRDHDRPLSDRGRTDAATVGRALALLQAPDQALVSSARRAHETFAIARDLGGWNVEPHLLDELYGGDPQEVIAVVADNVTTAETLLIVGHEPWCSGLIELLTGARLRMAAAALACMQVGPAWDALDPAWCALQWFAPPRMLAALGAR